MNRVPLFTHFRGWMRPRTELGTLVSPLFLSHFLTPAKEQQSHWCTRFPGSNAVCQLQKELTPTWKHLVLIWEEVLLLEIRLNVVFESHLSCFVVSVRWLCNSIAPALACFHLTSEFSSWISCSRETDSSGFSGCPFPAKACAGEGLDKAGLSQPLWMLVLLFLTIFS